MSPNSSQFVVSKTPLVASMPSCSARQGSEFPNFHLSLTSSGSWHWYLGPKTDGEIGPIGVRDGPKGGQISPKAGQLGSFSYQISVYFCVSTDSPTMGEVCEIFRLDFSTFWFLSQNVLNSRLVKDSDNNHLGPNWPTLGPNMTFPGCSAKMYWNQIWKSPDVLKTDLKSPRFIAFVASLTQSRANSDTPVTSG